MNKYNFQNFEFQIYTVNIILRSHKYMYNVNDTNNININYVNI